MMSQPLCTRSDGECDAQPSQNAIQVVSTTWNRNAKDLFDFEADDVTTESFTLEPADLAGPAQLRRIGNSVRAFLQGVTLAHPTEDSELLALCERQQDGSVQLGRPGSGSTTKAQWLVIRGCEGGHHISDGELIKLGSFKFRVRQLVADAESEVQPDLRVGDWKKGRGQVDINLDEVEDPDLHTCRICLMDEASEVDPLVRPCQCKGSIEYVHLGCLRHWIKDRMHTSGSQHGSYHWRPLPCELCKTFYPSYCRSKKRGVKEPLVQVPKPKAPYVVLENLTKDAHRHDTRGLHVISLAGGNPIKLGRGNDNDVSIADVSTSRLHATIRLECGQFIIEDLNSKFGTFASRGTMPRLEPGQSVSLQVGRTILNFSMQGPCAAGHCTHREDDRKSVSTCEDDQGEDDEAVISI